jgi:hypothetical protein
VIAVRHRAPIHGATSEPGERVVHSSESRGVRAAKTLQTAGCVASGRPAVADCARRNVRNASHARCTSVDWVVGKWTSAGRMRIPCELKANSGRLSSLADNIPDGTISCGFISTSSSTGRWTPGAPLPEPVGWRG